MSCRCGKLIVINHAAYKMLAFLPSGGKEIGARSLLVLLFGGQADFLTLSSPRLDAVFLYFYIFFMFYLNVVMAVFWLKHIFVQIWLCCMDSLFMLLLLDPRGCNTTFCQMFNRALQLIHGFRYYLHMKDHNGLFWFWTHFNLENRL